MHKRLWLLAGAALASVLCDRRDRHRDEQGRGNRSAANATPARRRSPSRGRTCRARRRTQGQERPRVRPGAGHRRLQHGADVLQRVLGRRPDRPGHPRRVHRQRQAPARPRPRVEREGDEDDAVVHDPADANWYWGGKKIPVTYKDFVYTWQQIVDPKNDVVGRDGYDQITGFTHKGDEADHVQVEEAVRRLAGPLRRRLSVGGARRSGLQQDLGELHLRQRRPARLRRPVLPLELHEGPGLDAEGEPVLVRQEAGPEGGRLQDHHRHEHRGAGDARRRGRRDQPDLRHQPAAAEGRQRRSRYNQVPGLYQEHIDIQFGPKGQPLLRRRGCGRRS